MLVSNVSNPERGGDDGRGGTPCGAGLCARAAHGPQRPEDHQEKPLDSLPYPEVPALPVPGDHEPRDSGFPDEPGDVPGGRQTGLDVYQGLPQRLAIPAESAAPGGCDVPEDQRAVAILHAAPAAGPVALGLCLTLGTLGQTP